MTTSSGVRSVNAASAAATTAWAASGTATVRVGGADQDGQGRIAAQQTGNGGQAAGAARRAGRRLAPVAAR